MIFDYKKEYQRYKKYYTTVEPFIKSSRFRGYFSAIATLLALSIFGYFAIRPTLLTIFSLNKQITDSRLVNQKLQEKINNLAIAQEKLTTMQDRIYLIDNVLPPDNEFTQIIKSLEKLAVENKATVSGISFPSVKISELKTKIAQTEEQKQKFSALKFLFPDMQTTPLQTPAQKIESLQKINFNFNITGSYQNVLNFFSAFIKEPRIVKINTVSITPSKDDSVSFIITAVSYYYQP